MINSVKLPNLKVASFLMIGLFFYDIYWVFYSKNQFGSSVMATVATNLNLPIKLVFANSQITYSCKCSMLGLGDIVIPGALLKMLFNFR